jgi:predicted RNA-binding protein with PIN domain
MSHTFAQDHTWLHVFITFTCRDETLSRLASQTELAFARGELETWVDAFAKEARTQFIIVYDAMMSGRQEVSRGVTN